MLEKIVAGKERDAADMAKRSVEQLRLRLKAEMKQQTGPATLFYWLLSDQGKKG